MIDTDTDAFCKWRGLLVDSGEGERAGRDLDGALRGNGDADIDGLRVVGGHRRSLAGECDRAIVDAGQKLAAIHRDGDRLSVPFCYHARLREGAEPVGTIIRDAGGVPLQGQNTRITDGDGLRPRTDAAIDT